MSVREVEMTLDRAAMSGVERVSRHGRVCPPYENDRRPISVQQDRLVTTEESS